jgi:hypothetical protein
MRGTLTRTGSGEPGARVFPRAPGPQSLPAPEYSVRDQPAANPGQRSHGGGERLAARERPFQRLEVERSSVALWRKRDNDSSAMLAVENEARLVADAQSQLALLATKAAARGVGSARVTVARSDALDAFHHPFAHLPSTSAGLAPARD